MAMRRTATSLVLAACLVVTAVASTGAAAMGHRATKTVRASGASWSPTTVRISTGDTIKWKAVSGSHTVTAYRGGWTFNKSLATGDVQSRVFRRSGTFRFRCSFHSTLANGQCSGMCGKVVVRS